MRVRACTNLLANHGYSSTKEYLASTLLSYKPGSFYTKLSRFFNKFSEQADRELTLSEAFELMQLIFTTNRDQLFQPEDKLYDNFQQLTPYHWGAAARMLIKNNIMSEDFWLLCSQNGNRGLSYTEILPICETLQVTYGVDRNCVINFLRNSSFNFEGVATAAASVADLRGCLLHHKNLFGIVLFNFKVQNVIEDVLAKPNAENIILEQMMKRMQGMGDIYEVVREWQKKELNDYAGRAHCGPSLFTPQLFVNSRKPSPGQNPSIA